MCISSRSTHTNKSLFLAKQRLLSFQIYLQLFALLAVCSSSDYRWKRGFEGYPHELETIDLGRAEETTHTIRFPLPVRTVRVTKTVAVPVPVPYPIRRDVPVPVHVPKPVPVPVSYPVPVPHPVPVSLQQHTAPLGLVLYDAGRSLEGYNGFSGATGSTGATMGHNEGSIGVVVGASYGVSGEAGAEEKYPGTVVNEAVGVNTHADTGRSGQSQGPYSYHNSYQSNGSDRSTGTGGSSDSYSITKSVEPSYDGGANSIQGYGEDAKGK